MYIGVYVGIQETHEYIRICPLQCPVVLAQWGDQVPLDMGSWRRAVALVSSPGVLQRHSAGAGHPDF